jgi:hypothetical protein
MGTGSDRVCPDLVVAERFRTERPVSARKGCPTSLPAVWFRRIRRDEGECNDVRASHRPACRHCSSCQLRHSRVGDGSRHGGYPEETTVNSLLLRETFQWGWVGML